MLYIIYKYFLIARESCYLSYNWPQWVCKKIYKLLPLIFFRFRPCRLDFPPAPAPSFIFCSTAPLFYFLEFIFCSFLALYHIKREFLEGLFFFGTGINIVACFYFIPLNCLLFKHNHGGVYLLRGFYIVWVFHSLRGCIVWVLYTLRGFALLCFGVPLVFCFVFCFLLLFWFFLHQVFLFFLIFWCFLIF